MRAADGRFLKGSHWRPAAPHWGAVWLREQYEGLGRSAGDIAADAGTTDKAILYWLKKHGIQRRNVSQARSIKHWGATGEANPMHGKTGAGNEALRFDPANAVTLCRSCHQWVHSKANTAGEYL